MSRSVLFYGITSGEVSCDARTSALVLSPSDEAAALFLDIEIDGDATEHKHETDAKFHLVRLQVEQQQEQEQEEQGGLLRRCFSSPPLTTRPMISLIACSTNIVAFANHGNELWCYGLRDPSAWPPTPPSLQQVNLPASTSAFSSSSISSLSVGNSHVAFIISSHAFAFGQGASGQLGDGLGTPFVPITSPVAFALPAHCTPLQVACGHDFTLLVTTSGSVLSCGAGAYYRLGHGSDEDQLTPKLIETLEGVGGTCCSTSRTRGISMVAAGTWHCIAVAHETNDVFAWGWNRYGQAGGRKTTKKKQALVVVGLGKRRKRGEGGGGGGGKEDVEEKEEEEAAATAAAAVVAAAAEEEAEEEMVLHPRRIKELDHDHLLGDSDGDGEQQRVVKVTCGSRHSGLLTSQGRVIVIGVLGLGHDGEGAAALEVASETSEIEARCVCVGKVAIDISSSSLWSMGVLCES